MFSGNKHYYLETIFFIYERGGAINTNIFNNNIHGPYEDTNKHDRT